MKAMLLEQLSTVERDSQTLTLTDIPKPEPGDKELQIRVSACGVCHTELDEIEGRSAPPSLPVVPGHEVIAYVSKLGPDVQGFKLGDRVGVGWIYCSSGQNDENISPEFVATGRDVNGGYAEYMVVPAHYAYHIPSAFSDVQAAPLLCAGGVGYRALSLTGIENGQALGFTGFGGSAHLVLQVARYLYPELECYVFARDETARRFARELGACWSGDIGEQAPKLLDAIIDTTPAWRPIIEAMANLRPGGRLVINAIRKEDGDKDCLLNLDYQAHLWMEKEIKSVANVGRKDIIKFLDIAAAIPIQPHVELYSLEDANRALADLKFDAVRGAKVLQIDSLT